LETGSRSVVQEIICLPQLKILFLILLLLLTAIGLSPGGSSPTLVQTKIKTHKTTTKIKKHKTTK
jgi:hypothetical protein